MKYGGNTLFVRNISPQCSENVIRETFGVCDDIEQVLFRSFPNRTTEFFAQIDFRTPKGVLEGNNLSGTPLLGVPCECSVVDPYAAIVTKQVLDSQQSVLPESAVEESTEPQGTQLDHIKKFRAAAEEKRLRTVHMAGLPDGTSEEALQVLCSQIGEVERLRLDEDGEGHPFALVEFKQRDVAFACKSRREFLVDGKLLVITEAKTMVDVTDFTEQSVHFHAPIYDAATMHALLHAQKHLNPKLAKARAAAAEILGEPTPALDQAEESEQIAASPESASLAEPTPCTASSTVRRSRRRRKGLSPTSERRSRSRRQGRQGRRPGGSKNGNAAPPGPQVAPKSPQEHAIDLDDLDTTMEIAVVPNTELLALGTSPSGSSEASTSPERRRSGHDQLQEPVVNIPLVVSAVEDAVEVEEAVERPVPVASPSPARSLRSSQGEPQEVADASPVAELNLEGVEEDADEIELPQPTTNASQMDMHVDIEGTMRSATEWQLVIPGQEIPRLREEVREHDQRGSATRGTPETTEILEPRWECTRCGEVNKPSRTRCNNCGVPGGCGEVHSDMESEAYDLLETDADMASASSSSTPSPTRAAASPRSVTESPARSVAESPARSVAESGEGISVQSEPVVDLDLEAAKQDNNSVESETLDDYTASWQGESADARARILHGG